VTSAFDRNLDPNTFIEGPIGGARQSVQNTSQKYFTRTASVASDGESSYKMKKIRYKAPTDEIPANTKEAY
jgi:hypothetical protein